MKFYLKEEKGKVSEDINPESSFVVIKSLSHVWLCVIPWTTECQASLFFTISWSMLKFRFIESVMPSNLCHPLLLLPSIFSSIWVFSNEPAFLIRWPKYWSFSVSPPNEYSGLFCFGIDWFDLLAIQGTLKALYNTTVQKLFFQGASIF